MRKVTNRPLYFDQWATVVVMAEHAGAVGFAVIGCLVCIAFNEARLEGAAVSVLLGGVMLFVQVGVVMWGLAQLHRELTWPVHRGWAMRCRQGKRGLDWAQTVAGQNESDDVVWCSGRWYRLICRGCGYRLDYCRSVTCPECGKSFSRASVAVKPVTDRQSNVATLRVLGVLVLLAGAAVVALPWFEECVGRGMFCRSYSLLQRYEWLHGVFIFGPLTVLLPAAWVTGGWWGSAVVPADTPDHLAELAAEAEPVAVPSDGGVDPGCVAQLADALARLAASSEDVAEGDMAKALL